MKRLLKIFVIICVCQSNNCANQGMPPGGPEDKTPPEIIHTIPDINSTNVPRTTEVEFEFSENIQDNSLKSLIFISPNPGKGFTIKAKGNKINLEFTDSLIANVTYSITLGTGIKDLRGNKLKESYTLGFATGDRLDEKQISGQVFTDKPTEVTVWAYFYSDGEAVNPGKDQPIYVTQCDNEGKFKLSNLASRHYRLFAVRDQDKNLLYNLGREQIGVTSSDVDLTGKETHIQNRLFRMMEEDSSHLKILSLDQLDRRKIRVRFSKPILLEPEISNSIILYNHLGDSIVVMNAYPSSDTKDIWSITTPPRDTVNFQLGFKNLRDLYGRSIQDTVNTNFNSVSNPDTTKPILLSVTPPDSSQLVFPNQPFIFTFSETMAAINDTLFTVSEDSLNPFTTNWKYPYQLEILPEISWEGNKWIQFQLNEIKFRDSAGNVLEIEKTHYSWKILNPDTLSSISGSISDQDSLGQSRFYLQLEKVGAGRDEKSVVHIDSTFYLFNDILPGKYILSGYRDADKNGIYSLGSTFPFVLSERFFVAQDTILVRAKWPNEGNNYTF